jgi:hypothetical protein
MMKKGEELWNARARLARALQDHDRYAPNTYGRRDAIHKHIPDAIEALVEAKYNAILAAAVAKVPAAVEVKGLKEFGPHD